MTPVRLALQITLELVVNVKQPDGGDVTTAHGTVTLVRR